MLLQTIFNSILYYMEIIALLQDLKGLEKPLSYCNLVPTQLKVAAYCRVSTNSLEQQTSLSSQEQYYEEWIKRIPHWTFAGIYSDIGSGTQAKGRRRFNAMISACQRGKIDTILTKSAHRFARNTVDALETIRMLRRWKVDIYFEIEGIHSLYESSEFLLAVVSFDRECKDGIFVD